MDRVQVNLFADTYNPIPIQTLTLAQALDEIRTGVYAERIAVVRKMLTRGEHSYRAAKNKLPAFTFAGTFAPSRANAHLQQHSRIIHGDLDHLSDVEAVKRRLAADPHTVYVFDSPSGTGLKTGIHGPVVPDDAAYKHCWHTIAERYEAMYGGDWDPSGKDIARLCYVSYDPEIYVNFDAAVCDVPPPPPPPPIPPKPVVLTKQPTRRDDPERYTIQAIHTATQMIQSAQQGYKHHARLRAARLLGGYVGGGLLSEAQAETILESALDGYTDNLARSIKTVRKGLVYGQHAPITLQALEAERNAWCEAHPRHTPTPNQAPIEQDPWAGMRTLPLKPYQGLQLRRKAVRRG